MNSKGKLNLFQLRKHFIVIGKKRLIEKVGKRYKAEFVLLQSLRHFAHRCSKSGGFVFSNNYTYLRRSIVV